MSSSANATDNIYGNVEQEAEIPSSPIPLSEFLNYANAILYNDDAICAEFSVSQMYIILENLSFFAVK